MAGINRLLATAAAVALILATGAAVGLVRQQQRADQLLAAQQAIASVLAAPDARTVSGAVAGGGTGVVVVSASVGSSVFLARGLPSLDEQTYQLWFMGSAEPISLGVLGGTGGQVTRILQVPPSDVTSVGLSVEPPGGSVTPTRAVLLLEIV